MYDVAKFIAVEENKEKREDALQRFGIRPECRGRGDTGRYDVRIPSGPGEGQPDGADFRMTLVRIPVLDRPINSVDPS